ncbi:MAG TPA: RDD family protein [Xanthomonadales bacterium]|nr:RDD family protein [Xanthomonadales bacterium]
MQSGAMLDTLTLVETPEGIALRLRTAGLMPRAAAWALDFMARLDIIWALATVFTVLGDAGSGLLLLAMFAAYWLYPILFEVLRDGQTIGKKIVGLRVVNANGTPVTWLGSIVRNLLRTVDMLPVCYGFGLVAVLADPQNRRLGDMVAGTLVVHVENPHQHSAAPSVPAVHAPVPLAAGEKAVIVAFAERVQQLTPERQEELAGLLPMLTEAKGPAAVQKLLGMANEFLGRK